MNDFFLSIKQTTVCNFADDNTLYCCGPNLDRILDKLKEDILNALNWFKINSMKANPEKFQFMVLGSRNKFSLNIDGINIESKELVTLLGLTIDNKLTFEKHISNLCKTACYKLAALQRLRKFISLKQAVTLSNAFINSQFNYCAIIWMFVAKRL